MSDQPEKGTVWASGPRKSCGALPVAFICATIAFIAYLVLSPRPEQTRRLWVPIVVDRSGSQTVQEETRELEFWTPSVRTKDYLIHGGREIGDREKWQVIPSDDVAIQFGAILHSNTDVFGYRRVEVWGQGRTVFKPGWWWTMNVTTNYSLTNLAHIYQNFWNSTQPVLIEVVDNRGSTEK